MSERGSVGAGLFRACALSFFPSLSPSCGFDHSLRGLFLPVILFFSFAQPNSADNGSADTVVGKITALHFSSLSLFPLHFCGIKGGRDEFFLLLKKRERNGGTECLTGEKVPVVIYSFLISEKTLVRKAGMKRWEGE